MKIYEIGTGYTPIPAKMGAATEIVVEELTRAFLKNGEDVEIVDIKARERDTDLPIIEAGVPSAFTSTDVSLGIMHKLKRVVYSMSLAFTLKKLLKKSEGEAVLHFHNQYNLYFFLKLVPAKFRRRAAVFYTAHSYIWHGEWTQIEQTVKKRYFQELYCLEHADRVFVLNSKTRENVLLHTEVQENRVVLIDNGVNTKVYSPRTPEEKEEIKKSFKVQNSRVFVQVGSVCDRKNQLGAVELLLPLMKKYHDVVYMYAGGVIDAEYQERIKSFARENGVEDRVIYVGELQPGKALCDFYSMGEAMVFPSKAEGFSLVIIEALSAGVPVAVSDSLEFKLKTSTLAYDTKEDFQAVLENKVLNKEARELLSKEVRQAVIDEYSWEKIADDYLASMKERILK